VKQQQLFNSFFLASTTAVLATQPAWADTVSVTAVRLVPTVSGLEVILETPKKASPSVFTASDGKTFVADIINTKLHLRKGKTFHANNPIAGISEVTVIPLNATSIRLSVTGKAGLPLAQVIPSAQGLVLSLAATSDTSLNQAQSRPTKGHNEPNTSTGSGQQAPKAVRIDKRKLANHQKNSHAISVASTAIPVSPSLTNTQPSSYPSYLNPNPNPLQFPTMPSEVRIRGTQPITLAQALAIARRNNRSLQVAQLTLERSRAALRQAQAALYPTVNLSATLENSGNAFINGAGTGSFTGTGITGTGTGITGTGTGITGTGTGITGTGTGITGTGTGITGTGTGITGTGIAGTTAATTTGGTTSTVTTGGTTTATAGSTTGGTTNAATVTSTGTPTGTTNTTAGGTTLTTAAAAPAVSTTGTTTGVGTTTTGTTTGVGTTGVGTTTRTGLRTSSSTLVGTVAVAYNLYTSGSRKASIRSAEEQVHFDQLGVEIQAEQTRLDIATAYYNLQQADQNVLIQESAVTNSLASLRDAQALEQAGVGTRFDVLTSQVQLANSTQNLTNAQAQQQINRRQLAQLLSISQSVDLSAADPIQIAGLWNLSLEDSIVLAFKNRAELDQQLATRNIAEQNRRLALSQIGPQVRLEAGYNVNDIFATSYANGPGGSDTYTVAAVASLLLFDGGAARANAAQQEANKTIAETNFANTRNTVRFGVEQDYAQLQANLANIQTTTVSLAEAREALRLARLRFQAGVGIETDVISSENNLTNAEGNRVNAILSYNRSLASLQRDITSGRPR